MRRTVAILLGTLLLASCGLRSGGSLPLPVGPDSIRPVPALTGVTVTVGSKDFTEQVILGYLIEFALAAAGADIRDLTNIQGSNSLRDAQIHGQIDIAFDYTGTGWINYLGHENPVADPRAQFQAVRDADLAAHGMLWAAMAPVNNTYALATTRSTGVTTLTQYAQLVATDPAAASTCVGTEFNVRRDGFPGMARAYNIDNAVVRKKIVADSLVYPAVAAGRDCRFGSVAATDGRIAALNLVLLTDDRHFFPQYNAALVLRKAFADAHPEVIDVLRPITALLTNEVMTELNRQVDVDGKEPDDVARGWLISHRFVTAGPTR